jgi:two-component system cell cycle response regulator DivK
MTKPKTPPGGSPRKSPKTPVRGVPAVAPRAAAEPPLVLIVDDFVDTREMYLEYLQFAGFRAIDASDGREAIAKAVELFPSIILMDLAMPTMDGWEATRRLKADPRTRSIPVIAVTGHALRGDAERAREAGCDGVISKPCLPETLVDEVKRVLARQAGR